MFIKSGREEIISPPLSDMDIYTLMLERSPQNCSTRLLGSQEWVIFNGHFFGSFEF
jgi:hypothetical protein